MLKPGVRQIARRTSEGGKKMRSIVTIACLVVATLCNPASAQTPLDSYVARIGPQDHFNSNGVRLTDAAAIIRQDRANLYAFDLGDPEDETDMFFQSRENRARMEAMLRAGGGSPKAVSAVVNGTPLIQVLIYEDAVEVLILD
jgi:hypothetical protein